MTHTISTTQITMEHYNALRESHDRLLAALKDVMPMALKELECAEEHYTDEEVEQYLTLINAARQVITAAEKLQEGR